ncbi:MAG TPA: NlpC/P60 family protein [Flavipsychrobacter sp.]|nr:NlpC/P60 family protein [Flavipsychrobacter sp.]
MNVKKITFILFAGLSIAFTSCHSSQELMEPKLSLKNLEKRQLETLDEISLPDRPISIKVNSGTSGSKNSNPLQLKYASILGVFPQTIKNLSLYGFIDDWYGVRYRLGGDSKKGIDCSAFVRKMYENVFCVNLLRTACEQFSMCRFVTNTDSVKEGDLVFFKTKGSRISHVGVYLMNNFFVHASSSRGVMISSLDEVYWERRYAGAGIINREEANL